MTLFWIETLAVVLELLIYVVFFHHFFGKAKYAKPIMAMIYAFAGAVSLCVSYFPVPDSLHFICYLLVIILLALCYPGQLFVKFFVPFVFQISSMAVEECAGAILAPMRIAVEQYGEAGFHLYYFTGVVLSNMMILLLIKVLAGGKEYIFAKRQDIEIPVYFAILFVVPLCMFYSINQIGILIVQTGDFSLAATLPIYLLTLMTIAFLLLFDILLQSLEHKKQIELLGKQLELEKQYHAVLLEKHQQFQGLRHDMKENMNAIANLIKNEHYAEAMHYAEQQSGQMATTSVIETGHPLLDAILTVKEQQANQVNAQMQTYVFANLQNLSIDMGDIASICSNALTNAIEAVDRINDRTERKIWFHLTQEKGYLHIAVRNTVAEDVKISSNQIPTTKANHTMHGFGLQIIQRVTAKYEGTCTLDCRNQIFSIKIILPIAECSCH